MVDNINRIPGRKIWDTADVAFQGGSVDISLTVRVSQGIEICTDDGADVFDIEVRVDASAPWAKRLIDLTGSLAYTFMEDSPAKRWNFMRVVRTAGTGNVMAWDGAAQGEFAGPATLPPFTAYDTLVLASNPIAYYKLDETAGLVMADSSGNANDGDYTATVTLGAPLITNDGGNSGSFSGVAGSFANIKPGMMDVATSTSPKTLEAWFNTTDTVGPIMVARGPTGTPILGIYMGNDGLQVGAGQIFVITRDNGSLGLSTLASPLTYNDGLDHHVVVTMDAAKNFILYIDGFPVHTSTHILTVGINTNDPQLGEDAITTGGAPHGSFAGRIDNAAIYNVALSAATILSHFNTGFVAIAPPALANLLHWFDFADPSTVWADEAGTIAATDGVVIRRVDNKGTDGTPLTKINTLAPTYRTGVLNGLNVADFGPGPLSRELNAIIAAGSAVDVNGLTMAAVTRRTNSPAGQNAIVSAGGASFRLNLNNPLETGNDDFSALWIGTSNPIILSPTINLFYLIYQSVDAAGSTNDAHYASPGPEVLLPHAAPTGPITPGTEYEMFYSSGDGDIAETLFYDRDLTDAERNQLVLYTTRFGTLPA